MHSFPNRLAILILSVIALGACTTTQTISAQDAASHPNMFNSGQEITVTLTDRSRVKGRVVSLDNTNLVLVTEDGQANQSIGLTDILYVEQRSISATKTIGLMVSAIAVTAVAFELASAGAYGFPN